MDKEKMSQRMTQILADFVAIFLKYCRMMLTLN